MASYHTIICERNQQVAHLWLNRPDKHNAVDEMMVHELRDCLDSLNNSKEMQLIVLRGKGTSFCAGADLKWITRGKAISNEENIKSAQSFSELLYELYHIKKVTLCIGHGSVIGGGIGLLSACDFSYSHSDTKFFFSEVKMGLVPAMIMPYVVNRIGKATAKSLMLTGTKISGKEAKEFGLVNEILPAEEQEKLITKKIDQILEGEPNALKLIKSLLNEESHDIGISSQNNERLAGILANLRVSNVVQTRIKNFLTRKKDND